MEEISPRQNSASATELEVTSLRSQIGPILFLAGIFFLNFLGRIILAPLLPTIEKDLGLDHAGAGSLFLLISSGYFVSLLGSGFVASRLMHKRTIIVSATAIGLALLGISFSNSLLGISMGLVLLGLAAGLYLPSGISTLTSLISPGQWGKALAIHELAPNLAFVAAPLISEVLLQWFSWRGIMAVMGIASMVAGVTFGRFGKSGKFQPQKARPL